MLEADSEAPPSRRAIMAVMLRDEAASVGELDGAETTHGFSDPATGRVCS